jgi:hypothetical protein
MIAATAAITPTTELITSTRTYPRCDNIHIAVNVPGIYGLQFGPKFHTVPRRPGQPGPGHWSSLSRLQRQRPEL